MLQGLPELMVAPGAASPTLLVHAQPSEARRMMSPQSPDMQADVTVAHSQRPDASVTDEQKVEEKRLVPHGSRSTRRVLSS